MNISTTDINEANVKEAFNSQSALFDAIYSGDVIISYKRQRVRDHILRHLAPKSTMLELNCGTGEDALFFAEQGHRVHATDISTGMLDQLHEKLTNIECKERITIENCSFNGLSRLQAKGPYDYVYSNFGGLNCTSKLDEVLASLNPLVRPGGIVTLVIISRFCLWETLLMFRGRFKTAFRRFFSSKGRRAHIEGSYFRCWYYSPAYIRKHMGKEFEQTGLEGLCTLVPPSYIEQFAEKRPKLFRFLKNREDRWKSKWPWKNVGDYFIISFRKQ